MVNTELAKKVQYLVWRMRAVRELCEYVADDYVQRIIARDVYVCLDSFIVLARQLKNQLPTIPAMKAVVQRLHERLKKMDADFQDNTPAIVRDKIAAHRQLLALSDLIKHWEDHDDINISILVDEAIEVIKDFDVAAGSTMAESSAPPDVTAIAGEVNRRIDRPNGTIITSDDLGIGQQGTLGEIALGPLAQKMQAIAGIMRRLKKLSAVSEAVRSLQDLQDVVIGEMISEAFNLIDNLFDSNTETSLLDIWKAEKIKGAQALEKISVEQTPDLEREVRDVRDHFAAHLDDKMTLDQIQTELAAAPLDRFAEYILEIGTRYRKAAFMDIRTRGRVFIEEEIQGFTAFNQGGKRYSNNGNHWEDQR